MAFGVKTNERPGTRAQLRYARFSAYKAREVLNLIRGKSVAQARDILQFTERGAADPILKTLESAIANAENNDGIAADELFISACFADEGPTLKRFRPRARGRAGKIRKRTCHVTIIVSRLSNEELERVRDKAARRTPASAPAASRAARVARSRKAARAEAEAAEAAAEEEINAETAVDDVVESDTDETVTDEVVADEAVETVTDEIVAEDEVADETATDEAIETVTDAATEATEDEEIDSTDAATKAEGDS